MLNSLHVAYLDFQKAFDKVPHERLKTKLKGYGISNQVIRWINDFLQGRRQKTVINGYLSEWRPVTRGIPQGSVLGPLLFVCYINDLPDHLHTNVKMFADDTKLYAPVSNSREYKELQEDIDKALLWGEIWQMKFNKSKCKAMRIGKDNYIKDKYTMTCEQRTTPLEETLLEKDLGVHIDNKLKFSDHINLAAKKTNSILGMIRRSYTYLDNENFNNLYKALVRPHLEYGNSVRYPTTKTDSDKLERVQRRATKLVPELKHLNYQDRLRDLNLPSLTYRRQRGDIINTYKYIHGIYKCDQDMFSRDISRVTRGHQLKLTKPRCNTSTRHNFFSNRIVNTWNALPDNVVTAPSLNSLKKRLDRHWSSLHYNIEADAHLSKRTT